MCHLGKSLFQVFSNLGHRAKTESKTIGEKRGGKKQKNFLSALPYFFIRHFLALCVK